MSNIYIQEPPTDGKVLLETTVGDIEIELWSKECPKAATNFVQLCMEKYYDKTKFHRVVKDFIVQGGDPTGTGRGGESVYGHPFKDEIHSRLRFVRRGLVAMANSGKDDNGSQFFFTFSPAPELQNKHTIFGKVVGNTIYNMLKLQEGEVDDEERPKYPNKIIRAKVISNPFPDLKPRNLIEMIKGDEEKGKKPKSKMKATKDFKLLSFGDEAEEEEEELDAASKDIGANRKGKSAHDLLKNDSRLLSEAGMEPAKRSKKRKAEGEEESEEDEELEDDWKDGGEDKGPVDLNSIKDKLGKKGESSKKKSKRIETGNVDEDFEAIGGDDNDEKSQEELRKLEIQREIKALKKELKAPKTKPAADEADEKEEKLTEEEQNNDMLRDFHKEQKEYASKSKGVPKKGAAREDMTLQLLAKFKQKLHHVKYDDGEEKEEGGGQAVKSEEKEKVEAGDDDEDEDLAGDGWMRKSLKFESSDPVLAKDASTKDDNWFDIYDPRNPLNKRRRDADAKRGGRSMYSSAPSPYSTAAFFPNHMTDIAPGPFQAACQQSFQQRSYAEITAPHLTYPQSLVKQEASNTECTVSSRHPTVKRRPTPRQQAREEAKRQKRKEDYERNKEEKKQKQRDYYHRTREEILRRRREEYQRNREKIIQRQRVYYMRSKEARKHKQAESYQANADSKRLKQAEYYHRNPEEKRLKQAEYYAKNQERILERQKQYYLSNREDILRKQNERTVAAVKEKEPKSLLSHQSIYSASDEQPQTLSVAEQQDMVQMVMKF